LNRNNISMMASNSLEKSEKNPNEKKFEKYEWLVSCYDIIKSFKPISSEEKSMSKSSPSSKKKSYLSNIKNKGKNLFDSLNSKKSSNKNKSSKSTGLNEQTSFEPNVAFVTEHFQNIRNSSTNDQNKNNKNNNNIDSKSIKSRQSYLQSVNSVGDVADDIEDSIKVEDSISNIKPNEDYENQIDKHTTSNEEKLNNKNKIPIIIVDDSKEKETAEILIKENKELEKNEVDDANAIAATVVEAVLKSSLKKIEVIEKNIDNTQNEEEKQQDDSTKLTNQINKEAELITN
jgi:hypothetical protein